MQALGSASNGRFITNASVVKQEPDGFCLFHSISFAIPNFGFHRLLEWTTVWIQENADTVVNGKTIAEWVSMETLTTARPLGDTAGGYAGKVLHRGWGSGIHMAASCMAVNGLADVHVWERKGAGFEHMCSFERQALQPGGGPSKCVANVLYTGGNHYDALVIEAPSGGAGGSRRKSKSKSKSKKQKSKNKKEEGAACE